MYCIASASLCARGVGHHVAVLERLKRSAVRSSITHPAGCGRDVTSGASWLGVASLPAHTLAGQVGVQALVRGSRQLHVLDRPTEHRRGEHERARLPRVDGVNESVAPVEGVRDDPPAVVDVPFGVVAEIIQ